MSVLSFCALWGLCSVTAPGEGLWAKTVARSLDRTGLNREVSLLGNQASLLTADVGCNTLQLLCGTAVFKQASECALSAHSWGSAMFDFTTHTTKNDE